MPDGGPSPFETCLAAESATLLARCCGGLSGRQRELLDLRYRDELTFAAIAKRWRVSEVAVHRMHGRALAALRARLAELRIMRLDEVV